MQGFDLNHQTFHIVSILLIAQKGLLWEIWLITFSANKLYICILRSYCSWFRRLAFMQEGLHFRAALHFFGVVLVQAKINIFHQALLFFNFEMMNRVLKMNSKSKISKRWVKLNEKCGFSVCTSTFKKCSAALKCSTKV